MEYDFIKNTDSGLVEARFSAEHEALGRWLTEEIGKDPHEQVKLLNELKLFKLNGVAEHVLRGREWSVIMDSGEVRIVANRLFEQDPDDGPDLPELSLNLEHNAFSCDCGLDDFEKVVEAWCHFAR